MKRYDYADRTIIEFDNKRRINYNHKKYGPLLEKVIVQAIRQQEKIWNPHEINGNITILFYWEQKTQSIIKIMIDTEDLDKIKDRYWQTYSKNRHICSRAGGERVWLHQFVLDFKSDGQELVVDHINQNQFDNRKSNLCITTPVVNQWNQKNHDTAGITKRGNKWRVTGVPRLHQKERLVDTYQEALEIRKQFVKEIEENLNL